MVRIKSAPDAICGLRRRAAKSEALPPRLSITGTACRWIGCPTSAWIPALDAVKSRIRACAAPADASLSARGDLHMFPVQTNSVCSAITLSKVLSHGLIPVQSSHRADRGASSAEVAGPPGKRMRAKKPEMNERFRAAPAANTQPSREHSPSAAVSRALNQGLLRCSANRLRRRYYPVTGASFRSRTYRLTGESATAAAEEER